MSSQQEIRQKKPLPRFGKKYCRLCQNRIARVDYKDIQILQRFCSLQQRILSRKRSGNCARHQRMVKTAIKRARYLALLPYTT